MKRHEVDEEDLKAHLRDFTRLNEVHSKRLTSRLRLMTVLMPTLLLLHGRDLLSSLKLCLERNEDHLSGLYVFSKMKN